MGARKRDFIVIDAVVVPYRSQLGYMKAVLFESAGKPEDVLRFSTSIQIPTPGPDEVLVRVEARPVQPADIMFIEGRYRIKPMLPQIAGLEGAGAVAAVGTNASIAIGTRVAFRSPGTWAEYAAVPVDRLYVVPDGVPIESAAQFALNPVTAWALLDELHLRRGDWIVINAATSAIAQIVHSLARLRSIGVVGIVRAATEVEIAFPAITAESLDLAARILESTNGAPAAGYLDSVGGMLIKNVLPALRTGATIISYGVLDQAPAPILNSDMIYWNLCWKGFGIDHWLATTRDRRDEMIDELWAAIRAGNLLLPVRAQYGLEEFAGAVVAARQPGQAGKVLIAS